MADSSLPLPVYFVVNQSLMINDGTDDTDQKNELDQGLRRLRLE